MELIRPNHTVLSPPGLFLDFAGRQLASIQAHDALVHSKLKAPEFSGFTFAFLDRSIEVLGQEGSGLADLESINIQFNVEEGETITGIHLHFGHDNRGILAICMDYW